MSDNTKCYEPILFCFSGPIASGKSTICRALVGDDPTLALSISTTTRTPRKGEVDGVDYNFVSAQEFKELIEKDQFIEYATFNDKGYGTARKNIENCAEKKSDLLLDIEVQGVEQLKKKFKQNLITVFVFPKSMSELKARLRARGTETEEQIARRLEIAAGEIETLTSKGFSDYLVVNAELDDAVKDAKAIIRAERARFVRMWERGWREVVECLEI